LLSEREREIVIGPDVTADVGICFMPSPDAKVVKNRVQRRPHRRRRRA